MKGLNLDTRQKVLILGALVALVAVGALFLLGDPAPPNAPEAEAGFALPEAGGPDARAPATGAALPSEPSPEGQPAPEKTDLAVSDEEDTAEEAEAEEEELDPSQQAAAVARALDARSALVEVSPALVNEPAWRALDRVATWYSQPSAVSSEMILSYLSHGKLWVRLATLQFMLAHPDVLAANQALLDSVRDRLVREEHPSQVRRFLERARAVDLVLYDRMKELLRV